MPSPLSQQRQSADESRRGRHGRCRPSPLLSHRSWLSGRRRWARLVHMSAVLLLVDVQKPERRALRSCTSETTAAGTILTRPAPQAGSSYTTCTRANTLWTNVSPMRSRNLARCAAARACRHARPGGPRHLRRRCPRGRDSRARRRRTASGGRAHRRYRRISLRIAAARSSLALSNEGPTRPDCHRAGARMRRRFLGVGVYRVGMIEVLTTCGGLAEGRSGTVRD